MITFPSMKLMNVRYCITSDSLLVYLCSYTGVKEGLNQNFTL